MACELEQFNNITHSYARSHEFNKTIFLKALFNMYSGLLICDLFSGHHSCSVPPDQL